MQINVNGTSIAKAVDGYKTYITIGVGMAVIAANHFGLLPDSLVPQGLDPNNWVNDEYKLIIGAVFRSAIAKNAPSTSDQYGKGGAKVS